MKRAVILPDSPPADKPNTFAAAIQAIMALPLSDQEKAEAVRRLLAGKGVSR